MKMMNLTFVKKVTAVICMMAVTAGTVTFAQSIVPKKDEKKGLWGYVSKDNEKWVVKPKYDEAGELTTSPNGQLRGIVSLKGKKGFVDDAGKLQGAGVVFEEMNPLEGDAMFVKVNGKTGVADYSGVYRVKPEAENVEQLGSEGWIMTIKGKKGLLKNDGTWLIEPIYTELDPSVADVFIVNKGGKAGILSRQGEMKLIPGDYIKVEPCENLWKVYKGDKVGLFDLTNNALLVKPDYSDVKTPVKTSLGPLYPVASNDKWGFINSKGTTVVKPNYSDFFKFDSPEAIILSDGTKFNSIYFPGRKNANPLLDYRISNNGVIETRSFSYKKNDGSVEEVALHTFPDGRIESGNPKIETIGGLCEIILKGKFSIWDPDTKKLMYEGKVPPNKLSKYLLMASHASDDKWKPYVETLKTQVINGFGKDMTQDAKTVDELNKSKDIIGEDNLNDILNKYPVSGRVKLIKKTYSDNKDLGMFLRNLYSTPYNTKLLSEAAKQELFKFDLDNGLLGNFTENDFEYTVLSQDGVAARYTGNKPNVTFPSKVDHEGVTYKVKVVDGAPNNSSLVTVTIPEGVDSIGNGAFQECLKLTTVTLPKNKVAIGDNAFIKCPMLSKVVNLNFDDLFIWSYGNMGDDALLSKYFWTFRESPKMLPVFLKHLVDTKTFYKVDDYIAYRGKDFTYDGIAASRWLAKNFLSKKAAAGNWEVMAEICNRHLKNRNSTIFTPSEYLKHAKMLIQKQPAFGYYFMGLAYEQGIGVKPSRTMAHSYYAKGRELNDKECDDGWWRTF